MKKKSTRQKNILKSQDPVEKNDKNGKNRYSQQNENSELNSGFGSYIRSKEVRRNLACTSPSNLPPLQFHNVHGDNIRISRDGTLARRFESFCRAITFSARPVRINERICVKFSETSNNWNGGIRFGFTNQDPETLNNALPKYVCPDLTNRPGFWAKALHEQYCEKDNLLTYYVNSVGDVIYGINNEEKGIILSGIDTRGLLWAVIDIYGNCTSIEFVHFNNYSIIQSNNALYSNDSIQYQSTLSENEVDGSILSVQSCFITNNVNTDHAVNGNGRLLPITFHATKGRNIILSNDCFIATRKSNDFCQGYVFTSRPILISEKITVEILETEYIYLGTLALGLTSCNPLNLQALDLPDDSDYLLDRPEYWVISKDIAAKPKRGDEISFFIGLNGEVTITINNGPEFIVMHVDQSLELWAFFDIYGSTKSIRISKCQPAGFTKRKSDYDKSHFLESSPEIQRISTSTTDSIKLENQNTKFSCKRTGNTNPFNKAGKSPSNNLSAKVPIKLNSGASNVQLKSVQLNGSLVPMQQGGAILVVNLPTSKCMGAEPNEESNILNSSGCSKLTFLQQTHAIESSSSPACNQWTEEKNLLSKSLETECTVCYENTIDSVLYMCGHMCMCFECAIEQWRGVGGGQCPLCRATIQDVIRTYVT